MSKLNSMPMEGSVVILIIIALFALALVLLFYVCARYRRLSVLVADNAQNSSKFLHFLVADYADAYKIAQATDNLNKTLDQSRAYLGAFNQTVGQFNDGVHDFSEFNYNLRGTIERMDLSLRDVVSAMRESARTIERRGDR